MKDFSGIVPTSGLDRQAEITGKGGGGRISDSFCFWDLTDMGLSSSRRKWDRWDQRISRSTAASVPRGSHVGHSTKLSVQIRQ